jgi:Leucine-rich repeat (LRR) protein
MQVDNSTLHLTPLVPQEHPSSTSLFPALLPLRGYHHRLSITTLPWSLPAFTTHVASLPAELIDMIQAFCSHEDLLSLTSVDKTALAARFCNPRLQKLCFKTEKDIAQFLSYCQASQERQAQALILEEGQKSRKRLKLALSPDTTTRFTSFTREHLQEVKALTLTLFDQFTAEQYELLFTYLPGIQHLSLYFTERNHCALSGLLKAAQRLTLLFLAVCLNLRRVPLYIEDHLPDELWQLTTLETLTISGFEHISSISEKIGQLNALQSLTLSKMHSLNALPASLGQLSKLKALTLYNLPIITALPEDIGQLRALNSLTLGYLTKLDTLPASLGQLNKLEALTLNNLESITALPEDIGQLNALKSLMLRGPHISILPEEMGQLKALKSLTLEGMYSLKALPAGLGQLDKLEALTLEKLNNIIRLPEEMGQLEALKVVKLIDMRRLVTLPGRLAQIAIWKRYR